MFGCAFCVELQLRRRRRFAAATIHRICWSTVGSSNTVCMAVGLGVTLNPKSEGGASELEVAMCGKDRNAVAAEEVR